ncbi:PLP-dependent aminotransferase family protein [Cronobacter dublinensis]|uniref:MocR-like transcription factor YczR n=1 Tax=Cronobacter dublinensis TaxID=413497 RepID=UPI000D00DBC8|nr:PLP-dependent aminotransferase family protein [Cronobacter dublinensis]
MNTRRTGSASLLRLLGRWQQEHSRLPVYRQLAQALRLVILDGRLPLASRLPGERELAGALGVSRTTIASALGLLRDEGFLISRHGAGSAIALPAGSASVPTLTGSGGALDLSTAALSAGPEVLEACQRAVAQLPDYLSHTGYDPHGLLRLREIIAARYGARGLPTSADQVMLVNGAVSGFALVLRLLTGPGDRVVVDNPTYPLAIAAIRGASCRPVPVSMTAQGWDPDGLAATFAQTSPRLAYLIPDYHNPTGCCMDAATRERVAAAAAASRTTLVVDETMVDLWYENAPPPPLAAFGAEHDVITLGSAGKSFWGGLRLGWIRASARTIASLVQMRDTLDLGSPLLEQLAVATLMEDSPRFLPPRRAALKARRDACLDAMQRYFPQWRSPRPEGGLSFWVELPCPLATRFAASAEGLGIHLGAGNRFGVDGAFERYLRMPFTLETERLEEAFSRLQPLWQQLMETRATTSRGLV